MTEALERGIDRLNHDLSVHRKSLTQANQRGNAIASGDLDLKIEEEESILDALSYAMHEKTIRDRLDRELSTAKTLMTTLRAELDRMDGIIN